MKKLLFLSLTFLLFCCISCTNDDIASSKEENKNLKTELFSVTTITENNYSNIYSSIESWESKSTHVKSNNSVEDLSIINVSYLPDTEIIFAKSDIDEYQYTAYLKDKNGIYSQFYMNVVEDDTFYNLSYYPVDNEPFSFKINLTERLLNHK